MQHSILVLVEQNVVNPSVLDKLNIIKDYTTAHAMILQQKTQQPVQFELTPQIWEALSAWIQKAKLNSNEFLFKSRRNQAELIKWQGRTFCGNLAGPATVEDVVYACDEK
jgi:hypothetical protein